MDCGYTTCIDCFYSITDKKCPFCKEELTTFPPKKNLEILKLLGNSNLTRTTNGNFKKLKSSILIKKKIIDNS